MAADHSLGDLAVRFGLQLRGDPDRRVSGVATLAQAGEGTLSFLANSRYRRQLAATRATAVLLSPADAPACPVAALITDNPYLQYARIATLLHPPQAAVAGIHPSAVVAPGARVAPSAAVAAQAVIEAGADVGERAQIGAGAYVAARARRRGGPHLGRRGLGLRGGGKRRRGGAPPRGVGRRSPRGGRGRLWAGAPPAPRARGSVRTPSSGRGSAFTSGWASGDAV